MLFCTTLLLTADLYALRKTDRIGMTQPMTGSQ